MGIQSNNVIQFPSKGNFIHSTLSVEELNDNVNMIKHNHINQTLETIIPMLFNNLDIAGFDILPDDEEIEDPNIKDCALLVESIRSLMCKYYDIEHPFQQLSEELFNFKNDGSLSLTKNFEIDFSSFEDDEETDKD